MYNSGKCVLKDFIVSTIQSVQIEKILINYKNSSDFYNKHVQFHLEQQKWVKKYKNGIVHVRIGICS